MQCVQGRFVSHCMNGASATDSVVGVRIAAETPVDQLGTPEDVAEAVI